MPFAGSAKQVMMAMRKKVLFSSLYRQKEQGPGLSANNNLNIPIFLELFVQQES
jgi:hypothetical protein